MILVAALGLSLLHIASCLDFGDLRVSSVGGELLQPSHWSASTFNLAKQFRLRNLAYSRALGVPRDPRFFPEEFGLSRAQRRHKRDVVVSRMGEQVTSMAVGVYRQGQMLIPAVNTVQSNSLTTSGDVTTSFIVGYEEEDGSVLDLKIDVSPSGVVTIYHASWNEADLKIDVDSDLSSALSASGSPLTLSLADGARVSDISLARDQDSGTSYLAVMVDLALDWPAEADRATNESMTINDPIAMPEHGRSRIYEFSLPDNYTYSYQEVTVVPSIEAKDGELFMVDQALHLVIAHRGNYTLDTKISQSLHLKLERDGFSSTFNVIQGYEGIDEDGDQVETDLSFSTQGPNRVKHFQLHNRDFLVFANTQSRNYSNSDEYSYVYTYKFDQEIKSGSYQLFQKLPTFKAMDVTFASIEDPYNPLNSQHFLVFANHEDIDENQVDSFVFKWIDGKFLPFQSLQLPSKALSVSSFQEASVEMSDGKQIDILREFLVFVLEDGKMKFFQFDGHIFQEDLSSQPAPTVSHNGVTQAVVSVEALQMEQNVILNLRYENGMLHQAVVEFDTASVINEVFNSSGQFRDYVDHQLDSLPDIRPVYDTFLGSPKRSENPLKVENVTFDGDFSVDEIHVVPEMLPRDDSDEPVGETWFAVTGKTTLDASLIDQLEKLNSGVETIFANNIAAINVKIQEYETRINASAKTNEDILIQDEIIFHNLTVSNVLKADQIIVDIDDQSQRSIFTSDEIKFYDLVEYMENAIYLEDPGDVVISQPMTFENLRIVNDYIIHNLNGVSLTNYWHSEDDSLTVPGLTTLTAGATFAGASSVAGTVAGITFTDEKLLLKIGDQTLTGNWSFSGNLTLPDITTLTINGFDLSLIDSVVTFTEEHILMNQVDKIYVDNLILPALGHDTLHILHADFPHSEESEVYLTDLMEKSLLWDEGGDVLLSYDFSDDVTISSVTLDTLNDVQFPEGFIPFNDPNCVVECNGTLILDNVHISPGVEITLASSIKSGDWTYSSGELTENSVDGAVEVDEDGNLELLLLGATSRPNYSHSVTGRKNFTSVHFMENVTVTNFVLGYNMTKLLAEQEQGLSLVEGDYSITQLNLSSVHVIDKIVLSDGLININSSVVNMTDVFSMALDRNVTSWPSSITNVTFSNKAEFLDDLSVESLNTFDDEFASVDPENDFLRVSGSPVTFLQPVTFTEDVTFTADLLQDTENDTIQACDLGYDEKCLCSDCSSASCEEMGGDCVFTDEDVDTSLYTHIRNVTLDYFEDNSLKLSGDQTILPKLVFRGGFTAVDLNVTTDDCEINSVSCDDIALTNSEQTFTGLNTFHGNLNFHSDVIINEELSVNGTVDNEDLDSLYTDSLYKALEVDGEAVIQNISQVHTFTQDIFIKSLVTNDINISISGTDLDPAQLFSNDYVLDDSSEAVISGDLIFEGSVSLSSFDVTDQSVTWDGITLDNFFHNILLNNGSDQTISGDVVVDGSLTISTELSKADSVAETKINQVDLVELDSRALRVSGDNVSAEQTTLGDVSFGIFKTAPEAGILLEGTFLGVNITHEAVTKTISSTVVITVGHEFSGGLDMTGEVSVAGSIESTGNSSQTFAQDRLLQFIDGDPSVTKVRVTHPAGARALREPVMTSVNTMNLASLRSDKWHSADDVTLTYHMVLANANFTGQLDVDTLNTIDLLQWRDSYLSLSQHQNITAEYNFDSDLVFNGNVSVEKVFVGEDGGSEGDLKTLSTSTREATDHKFTERYFNVMFRNITYDSISTVLSPDNATVKVKVMLDPGVEINGVDISENVLTYKDGDMKTFINNLTINGDMKIVNGSSEDGDVNLLSNLTLFDEITNDTIISLIPSDRYPNAISQSDDDSTPIAISGEVNIRLNPTFSDLVLESGSTINSADIGSCSSPEILTIDNCDNSSSEQIITTSLNFSTTGNTGALSVAGVVFSSNESMVNDKVWEQELEDMISKTDVVNVTITHTKTFYQAEFNVDSGVEVDISSTLFGLSSDSHEKTFDMSFPSGLNVDIPNDDTGDQKPVMPDLVTALNNIEHNSMELPAQFLYYTPLMTETNTDLRVKNIDVFTGNGLLPDNATTEDWEAMPFHMITLLGDVTTEEVSLAFSKLSQLEGDINVTRLTPGPSPLPTSLTYRDTDGHLTMVDVVALKQDGDWYYLLTTLTDDVNVADSLVDGVSLNNGTVVLLLKWDYSLEELEVVQNLKQNWNDLSPVKLANKSCVVGCGVNSEVLCFSSGTYNSNPVQYLAPSQDLSDLGECFKASSVEIEEDGNSTNLLVIASNFNSDAGLVTILKSQDLGNFSDIQTIPCYYCSFADLGQFDNEVFIAIMSESTNFIYIGKYDLTEDKFVIFQNLNLLNPQEAQFYNREGQLLLSVLAKVNQRKEIFTFVYQGSMSFVEDKEKAINLLGVESHNILSHSLLGSQLISSTGVPAPGRILSANTLLQATYKQTDIASVREELDTSPGPLPLMLSEQCKDMALNYVEELYQAQGGIEDPDSYAKLVLRLLPRPFLQFDTDSFQTPIQEMYANAESSLMISNQAEAYIIFYAYTDFSSGFNRDLDSSAFRGTGLVFQDKDGVLFLRFRIKDAPFTGQTYRGFSILDSCSGGVAVDFNNTFSSGNYSSYGPTESPVAGEGDDVQEVCAMVHDFPLVDELKELSGSGDVAAVSLEDSAGDTFACGYMKHPQQSMITLIEEHGDLVDDARLVLQN